MKIAILGSTGFVGRVLLARALKDGHQVRTLVRNPDKLGEFRDRVELVKGDVFEIDRVEETVRGAQVLLSTVPPEAHARDPQRYAKLMEELLAVLKRNSVRRFIHIGGAAHGGGEGEAWSAGRRFLRGFLKVVYRQGLVAKQLEWEALRKSDLDWTLVRPPRIASGRRTGTVLADERKLAGLWIDVDDLVDFMLKQISSDEWVRRAPLVASGRKPG